MPNLWIPNIDEIGPSFDPEFSSRNSRRYLWTLAEGDVAISPVKIDSEFLYYVRKVKGLKTNWPILIPAGDSCIPLMKRIFADEVFLQQVKSYIQGKDFKLLSYMATPLILELSKKLAIPLHESMPTAEFMQQGLAFSFNCKWQIKNYARELDIPVVESMCADSLAGLLTAIHSWRRRFSQLIVKKAMSGGGDGNLSLTTPELLAQISPWYHKHCLEGERLLVEPYLPFSQVVGAISSIHEHGQTLGQLDLQIIRNNGWSGAIYPYLLSPRLLTDIKKYTLKLGEKVRSLGGRGLLNLDFGVINNRVVLIESNFRFNGLHLLGEIAKLFDQSITHLCYDNNWPLLPQHKHLLVEEIKQNLAEGVLWLDHDHERNQKQYILLAQSEERLEQLRKMSAC